MSDAGETAARGILRRWVRAGAILALLGACASAQAQAIYKCKDADGHITYSSIPCPGEGARLAITTQSRGVGAPTPPAPVPQDAQTAEPSRAAEQGAPPSFHPPLPRQCDNAGMLQIVVARLDSPATPDDIRSFLADERFRLVRCEFTRFTPEERREHDGAMRDLEAVDPARRRAAALRIEALYERYQTPAERAARARNRQ